MKLLIVDDEEITREGIIQRMPWSELGVSQIQQADDGINALRIVENFVPDIVLTDVRMPRMDGIQMSIRIKELYPQCTIIFTSGYSDREYLKAAIQLKAIDYVDKPIRMGELTAAITKAVIHVREFQSARNNEQVFENYYKVGMPLLKSELALSMLNRDSDINKIIEQSKAASVKLPIDGYYNTIVIKFILDDRCSSEYLNSIKMKVWSTIENAYPKYKFNTLPANKHEAQIILHLYADYYEKHLLSEDKLLKFFKEIIEPVESDCNFIISSGKTVRSILNVCESYETALKGMARVFFKGYNRILVYEEVSDKIYKLDTASIRNLIELVKEERREESIFYITSLSSNLRHHLNTPVKEIRNFFYTVMLEIYRLALQKEIKLFEENMAENHLWDRFLKFNTLSEIEEFMTEKLNYYFESPKETVKQVSLIDKILIYIQNNYSDPDLSIDKISDYTHFAPTYICSVFKEKTDKTLNQYITEYRIEISKKLLKDVNIKVGEIAQKIGCRDSGYFTKLFRKITGITPSEYRERFL